MAEPTPIQIQIDPETLREQVRSVMGEEMEALSWRFRQAADALDGGAFLKHWDENNAAEYKRGFEAGRAEGTGQPTNQRSAK